MSALRRRYLFCLLAAAQCAVLTASVFAGGSTAFTDRLGVGTAPRDVSIPGIPSPIPIAFDAMGNAAIGRGADGNATAGEPGSVVWIATGGQSVSAVGGAGYYALIGNGGDSTNAAGGNAGGANIGGGGGGKTGAGVGGAVNIAFGGSASTTGNGGSGGSTTIGCGGNSGTTSGVGGNGGTVYMVYGGVGYNGYGTNGNVYVGAAGRGNGANLYVYGRIHGLNGDHVYFDLSPYWNSGAEGSALEAALRVGARPDGDLDHSTLPVSLRGVSYQISDTIDAPTGIPGEMARQPRIRTFDADPSLSKTEREAQILSEHTELTAEELSKAVVYEERNLGAHIGMNTAAVQELHALWKNDSELQDQEIAALKSQNEAMAQAVASAATQDDVANGLTTVAAADRAVREAPWIEVPLSKAWEEVEETVLQVVSRTITKYRLELGVSGVPTITPYEVTETVKTEIPTGKKIRRLKEGVRFDETEGKLYRARTLEDGILGESGSR